MGLDEPYEGAAGCCSRHFLVHDVLVEVRGSAAAFFEAEYRRFMTSRAPSPCTPCLLVHPSDLSRAPEVDHQGAVIRPRGGGKGVYVCFKCIDHSQTVEMKYEEKPWSAFVFYIAEAVLHLMLLKVGKALIHGAAFSVNGSGILLCAWGGTGKTTTVLELMMHPPKDYELEFLGDDWVVVDEYGHILAYPRRLRVYGYNLREFPELLPRLKRWLILSWDGLCGRLASTLPWRWGRLAAEKMRPKMLMPPEEIFKARLGVKARSRLVTLLRKAPGVGEPTCVEGDHEKALLLAVKNVKYERDYIFKEYYRWSGSSMDEVKILEAHDEVLTKIVEKALSSSRVLEVRVPTVFTRRHARKLFDLLVRCL